MGYLSITSTQIVLQILFYLTVNSQAQTEPILNVTKIKDWKPFTITCAANRVMSTNQEPLVDDLFGLGVYLDTPAHPNMISIAQYHPSAKGSNMQFTNVTTPGWTVMFSGNTSTGNRQTLKIEVVVQTAVCKDAGQYRCLIQYLSNGLFKSPNVTQNVTAEAATTVPGLSLQPLKSKTNSFSNYSMYDLGEMVTMTCRINGPPNMAIVWRQERRPSNGSETFQDYPVQNDIRSENELLTGPSAACSQFQYVSRLKFNVSDEDTKRVYQCVIQVNGVDSLTVSATIDVIPFSQTHTQPILNVTTIEDGKPFTITCAANRVISPNQEPLVNDLFGLEVYLDTPAHPNMINIAQYHTSAKGSDVQFTNVTTPGWVVNFSGDNNSNTGNRQTLKIEVVVQKAVTADAGKYKCLIQYLNDGVFKSPYMTQNVTAGVTASPVL